MKPLRVLSQKIHVQYHISPFKPTAIRMNNFLVLPIVENLYRKFNFTLNTPFLRIHIKLSNYSPMVMNCAEFVELISHRANAQQVAGMAYRD